MRVSTENQNHDLQRDALTASGCERIYQDVISGAAETRTGLSEALAALKPGDTFIVWRLDRLGRSLVHLVNTVNDLAKREIGFRSLQEGFDTTHNGGRLVFHIFAALAEFERGVIRERTQAGLQAARSRGRIGGRPAKMDDRKVQMAKTLIAGGSSMAEVAEALGIHAATLYRAMARDREQHTAVA
jgi:DNA invertase Pin-like site-specific DNA recombinase